LRHRCPRNEECQSWWDGIRENAPLRPSRGERGEERVIESKFHGKVRRQFSPVALRSHGRIRRIRWSGDGVCIATVSTREMIGRSATVAALAEDDLDAERPGASSHTATRAGSDWARGGRHWPHLGLAGILLLALTLRCWRLGSGGLITPYYSPACAACRAIGIISSSTRSTGRLCVARQTAGGFLDLDRQRQAVRLQRLRYAIAASMLRHPRAQPLPEARSGKDADENDRCGQQGRHRPAVGGRVNPAAAGGSGLASPAMPMLTAG
jgi:hypothetical protein